MVRFVVQITIAILIAIASTPLAATAAETVFGPGALAVVPTCCAAFWLSVSSANRSQRIGWFVFASVVAGLLPTSPWWAVLMHDGSVVVQDFVANGSFLYRLVEAIAFCSMFVLPLISSCLIGWFVAKRVRNRIALKDSDGDGQPAMSFTLRGLLTVMVIIAGLTTWLSSRVSQWEQREQKKQEVFVDFFKRSFASGEVELLQEPHLSLKSGHGGHYLVTAPIRKNGEEVWGRWKYWADHPSFLYTFGYAEAPNEDELSVPVDEHLPRYSAVVDGAPVLTTLLKIIKAEMIEDATPTRGAIIEIIAKTEQAQQCELIMNSSTTKTIPKMKIAPESGRVSWKVQLKKNYRGSQIEYEVISRVNPIYRAKKAGGVITLRESETTTTEGQSAGSND